MAMAHKYCMVKMLFQFVRQTLASTNEKKVMRIFKFDRRYFTQFYSKTLSYIFSQALQS